MILQKLMYAMGELGVFICKVPGVGDKQIEPCQGKISTRHRQILNLISLNRQASRPRLMREVVFGNL